MNDVNYKTITPEEAFELRKNKSDIIKILMYVGLIILGTNNSIFSYAAFILGVAFVLFMPFDFNVYALLFIVPFASIFKSAADGQSFFTYVLLLFVLGQLLKKSISSTEISMLLFGGLIVVMQLVSETGLNVTKTIKLIMGIELIYVVCKNRDKLVPSKIFGSFAAGNLLASLLARFGKSFFRIEEYIQEKTFIYETGTMDRFSGLYADPNYYGVNLIVIGCILILLFHSGKIKVTPFILGMALVFYFSVLTYSKSVFMMLVFIIWFYVVSKIKQKKYATIIIAAAGAFVFFMLIYSNFSIFDAVLYRFNVDGISDLTTGRSDIWNSYLQKFLEEPQYLVLGRGITAGVIGKFAAHNTYIQLIYYLGAVGAIWLLSLLATSKRLFSLTEAYKSRKRNLLNYSIMICVLVMYFFLSELFYIDAPFHILLAFLAMSCDTESLDAFV